jgi:hypothetical protein
MPMTVELTTRELRPGGTLAGTVTANPTVEQNTRGLRVQLVSERHEQDDIVVRDVEAVVTLTGEADLRPGVSISSPFQIAAPADLARAGTRSTTHSTGTWRSSPTCRCRGTRSPASNCW